MSHCKKIPSSWILQNLSFMIAGKVLLLVSVLNAAEKLPIMIWSDVPDTSILRVGETYYMSSTTMHLSPGLPVMVSKDLVNWKIASYAHQNLAETDELNLENGKNAYGKGTWASSLRFHNGIFYLSTFSLSTGKTYVFTTRDPEKEAWKEASFSPLLHDSSLFFEDDGRVYMFHGSHNIRLTELSEDARSIKPGGVDEVVIPNASYVAGTNIGLRAEGTQVFKINGKYYVFGITWPRDGMRTAILFRSDNLRGPYEGRIVFQDAGIAQGGIFDTPDGKWYAVLFQDAGAVGRIPYLLPVRWEEDFPVIGDNGRLPHSFSLPGEPPRIPAIVTSDSFDDSSLSLVWQWNHNPDPRCWSLSDRKGCLRLSSGRTVRCLTEAKNILTQRTFGPNCFGKTTIDVSNLKNGDYSGLVALQKEYAFIGVKKEKEALAIVVVKNQKNHEVEEIAIPLEQARVHLKLSMDFQDRRDLVSFSYSLDGKEWISLGTPMKMNYTLPHFMGYRFGLFHFATQEVGGYTDFEDFLTGFI
ncbi:MAG: glycoside hydrolase 43 family protein [Planctomycetia bacterium]|nr:glycoside hydrolase 43 family protein [Planctomycetia bacterium]